MQRHPAFPWTRRLRTAALALAAVCSAAAPAAAEDWQVAVTPYLWVAGITGSIRTPVAALPTQQVGASFGDLLAHLNAVPVMVAGEARTGRFGVSADLMAISVKGDIATTGPLFSGGSAQLTQIIGTGLVTFRLVETANQALDAGLGVRAFGIATKFSLDSGLLPGFSRSPGMSWADPIIAARYHYEFGSGWGLTAYGDIGGGPDSDLTWQAFGTVDYRLSGSTTFRAGYRYLNFQHSGPVLQQNMGMGGPIIGATIRF